MASFEADGQTWYAFRFDFDAGQAIPREAGEADNEPAPPGMPTPEPEAVDDEALATALTARVSGWIYRLPEFKQSMLAKRLDELVTTEAPDTEPRPQSE